MKSNCTEPPMLGKKEYENFCKSFVRRSIGLSSKVKTALFWMDVDNMGLLNKNYGHDTTNIILNIIERQIIIACKNEMKEEKNKIESDECKDNNSNNVFECIPFKPHDTGDEFNVLYLVPAKYDNNNEKANIFAESLRKRIEMSCRATISIGVTYFNNENENENESSKTLKDRANKYLVEGAKKMGKNCVFDDSMKFLQKKEKEEESKTKESKNISTNNSNSGSIVFHFENCVLLNDNNVDIEQLSKLQANEIEKMDYWKLIKYFGGEERLNKLESQMNELNQNLKLGLRLLSQTFTNEQINALLKRMDLKSMFEDMNNNINSNIKSNSNNTIIGINSDIMKQHDSNISHVLNTLSNCNSISDVSKNAISVPIIFASDDEKLVSELNDDNNNVNKGIATTTIKNGNVISKNDRIKLEKTIQEFEVCNFHAS